MPELNKRETAYKIRVGELLKANQIFDQTPQDNNQPRNPRLMHLELGDKKIVRINLIANVVDKYESEGEKRFASLTVEDWATAFNNKYAGITATTTTTDKLILSSNKVGSDSSLEVLGGSYASIIFSGVDTESTGQNSDFSLR